MSTTGISFTLGAPSGCYPLPRGVPRGQAGPRRGAEPCRPGWASPPWALPTFHSLCPSEPGSGRTGTVLPRSGHGGPEATAGSCLEMQARRSPVRDTGMWSRSRVCKLFDRLVWTSELQAAREMWVFSPTSPWYVTLLQHCGETRSGSELPCSGPHTL